MQVYFSVLFTRKVQKQAVDETQKLETTPQEVQKAEIAHAAEQKQDQNAPTQQQGAKEQAGDIQNKVKANQQQAAKNEAETEQKQEQRRR